MYCVTISMCNLVSSIVKEAKQISLWSIRQKGVRFDFHLKIVIFTIIVCVCVWFMYIHEDVCVCVCVCPLHAYRDHRKISSVIYCSLSYFLRHSPSLNIKFVLLASPGRQKAPRTYFLCLSSKLPCLGFMWLLETWTWILLLVASQQTILHT